jgi:hypothetical protein
MQPSTTATLGVGASFGALYLLKVPNPYGAGPVLIAALVLWVIIWMAAPPSNRQ